MSITPMPNALFRGDLVPPNGPNFYYVSDPVLDKILNEYAVAIDPAARLTADQGVRKALVRYRADDDLVLSGGRDRG